ncbi:MAG: alcohol dehydrogenase catalytic domain-containing protein [Rectinemataceae bacterium]
MKAVKLFGAGDIRVVDVPIPEIGEGDVLVRIKAALICGTDIRMWKNGAGSVPVTLGHEMAGTIEKLGPSVRDYAIGQAVAVAPNFGCGICDACVSGRGQHCSSLKALGIHLDGGFAEYMRVPAAAVGQGNISPIDVSDGISFAEAAIAEPLSCVYNSFERAHLKPGDSVLVIGAGPIGLLHAKLYAFAGAGLVMIHDLNRDRLAACEARDSAFVTIGPERVKERVMELTEGRGADIIVTAASNASTQQLAFGLAALDGRVIFFGGLPAGQEVVGLDTNVIHYKQITVTGTTRQSLSQYRRCLGLIGRGQLAVSDVITTRYPLEKASEAFEAASRGEGLKSGFEMP